MADYIYLLEHRLSSPQRNALRIVRELARSRNLTVFLVGGAVRDLTSGSPVRDLDVAVQGNALKLQKDIEKAGGVLAGEIDPAQALFVIFPGGVRMEISSTLSVSYPKPGKAVYKPASILEDLRRRDFTANAMALSLNEGSYGLLMDPLNGVADIENRELRLVSNYGFIEDPIRMVRAARLMARLGWTLDEKTQSRYEAGKQEGYITAATDLQRGYETEEIVYEEDALRILKRLESEGWMQFLAPFWTSAKVDVASLEHLRETQTQLQMQGIHPDASAANFPLLTAKLSHKEVAALKGTFPRQGFVQEIDSLDAKAKDLAALLTGKAASLPSQSWKIITSAPPEAVLLVAHSTRSPALQQKFKSFSTAWPQARQKIPYVLMQEMRILPELPGYDQILEKLFFELMDEKLQTPEELKAFLEPFSPPAPPPPINVRRPRTTKKDSKAAKSRAKKAPVSEDSDEFDISAVDETGSGGPGEVHEDIAKVELAAAPETAELPKATSDSVSAMDASESKILPAKPASSSKRAGEGTSTTPPRKNPVESKRSPLETGVPLKAAPVPKAVVAVKPTAVAVKPTAVPTAVKKASKAASAPAKKPPVPAKNSPNSAKESLAPAKKMPAGKVPPLAAQKVAKATPAPRLPAKNARKDPAKSVASKVAKKVGPPAKSTSSSKPPAKQKPKPAVKISAKKVAAKGSAPAKKGTSSKAALKKSATAKARR